MESECKIITRRNYNHGRPINLDKIVTGIKAEFHAVLPVTRSDLEQSFNSAMSALVVRFNNGAIPEALGHVRFSPLLDSGLQNLLSTITNSSLADCPEIWEMGSGFMDPELRGKGWYGPLRNKLLVSYLDKIKAGEVIILGTTKTARVLLALKESLTIGLKAFYCHHETLPMISALTCICQGEFGQGFQYGADACHKRVSRDIIPIGQFMDPMNKEFINSLPRPDVKRTDSIPCCLYMYGMPEQAMKVEEILRNAFLEPDQFVRVLNDPRINYYQKNSPSSTTL